MPGEGATAGIPPGGSTAQGDAGSETASAAGGSDGGGAGSSGEPGRAAGGRGEAGGVGPGGTPAQEPIVNECVSFVERSSPSDLRAIDWNIDIGKSALRCMQIALGQTVTWSGIFERHPLSPLGGDQPNPITTDHTDSEQHSVTFPDAGTFGFICENHGEMRGAIHVLP